MAFNLNNDKLFAVCMTIVLVTLITSIAGYNIHANILDKEERVELMKKIESIEIEPCEACLRKTFWEMRVRLITKKGK